MANVFISYSRTNRRCVRDRHAALVQRDHCTGNDKAGVRTAGDTTGRRIVTDANGGTARVAPCDACGTPDDPMRTAKARMPRAFAAGRARSLPGVKP